ncbi:MAG: thrombospondin type 3 repeat-containing protein [Gammaproteobacteria bacterium]
MRAWWGFPMRALLLAGFLAGFLAAPAAWSAPVTWQGWTFDYSITSNEGLKLKNVTFQGRTLLASLSMPVIRVFYDNNACGPYADRLGSTVSPIPWFNNETLAQREFTVGGKVWYEIGIRDNIGNYDLYQVYYLSADGTIDAHIYSKGLQCLVDHVHYPNWRIDLDLDGATSDQIQRDSGAGFVVMGTEFDADASTAVNHAWRVRDATTGLQVDVLPGFADFSIPDGSITQPVAGYTNHTVFGRLYRSSENAGWTFGPNVQVPYNDGENIDGKDIVLWYEGYLPHSASEGSNLWHSTGVRLVSNLTPPPPLDTDGDGVPDASDNCTLVANPDQFDGDGDGYGNLCDADLNNDGFSNAQDTVLFRARIGTSDAAADLNHNGFVNAQDTTLFRKLLGLPPGPSGLHTP